MFQTRIDTILQDDPLNNVILIRYIYILGAIGYLIYGIIGSNFLGLQDPLIPRVIISTISLLIVGITYTVWFETQYLQIFNQFILHLMNIHFMYLLFVNQFSSDILMYFLIYIGHFIIFIPYTFDSLEPFNWFFSILVIELGFTFIAVGIPLSQLWHIIIIISIYFVMIYFLSTLIIIFLNRLVRSNEQIEFILNNSPIIFCKIDNNGIFQSIRGNELTNLELDKDELIGKSVFDKFAQNTKLLINIELALDGKTIRDFIEIDNEIYDSLWAAYTVDDQRKGVLGIAINVTKHMETLEELKKTQDMIIKNQKLEAVGKLSSSIAHDFNNLLSVISLNNDLIQFAIDSGNYEGIEVQTSEIEKQIDHASYLTDRLTSLSKTKLDKQEIINVRTTILEQEEMLRRVLREDIELEITCQKDNFIVMDPVKLEQIMLNLIINARDAIEENIGKIKINNYKELHQGDEFCVISVSDNGKGMDEITQKNALDPFFTTKEEGSGLGLYSIHNIVKGNNGKIDIITEKHNGTTIKIYLPSIKNEEFIDPEEEIEKHITSEMKNYSIILVEDEQSIRYSLTNLLEKMDTKVTSTSNAVQALEYIKNGNKYDLLITDIILPKMSGIKLSELALKSIPDIKIIFMSGYTRDLKQETVNQSNIKFIAKPFSSEQLILTIKQLLN